MPTTAFPADAGRPATRVAEPEVKRAEYTPPRLRRTGKVTDVTQGAQSSPDDFPASGGTQVT